MIVGVSVTIPPSTVYVKLHVNSIILLVLLNVIFHLSRMYACVVFESVMFHVSKISHSAAVVFDSVMFQVSRI